MSEPNDTSIVQRLNEVLLGRVRECLLELDATGVYASGRKERGSPYRHYRFSDLEILLEHEDLTFTDDNPAVRMLNRPNLVLYGSFAFDENDPDAGIFMMEWQLIVETPFNDRTDLKSFDRLCQNSLGYYGRGPSKYEELWNQFGFAMLEHKVTPIRNGACIAPELKSKLLLKSIVCKMKVLAD